MGFSRENLARSGQSPFVRARAHLLQRLSRSRWHDVLSCNYLCNSRLGHLTFLVFLPEFFPAASRHRFEKSEYSFAPPSLSSFIHLLFSRRHLTSRFLSPRPPRSRTRHRVHANTISRARETACRRQKSSISIHLPSSLLPPSNLNH